MKQTNLRNALAKASSKLTEAECAVSALQPFFVFHNFFGEEEPQVTACSGGEIILEYRGHEMPIEEAIERMEDYGFISKSDFNIIW
jgi:hypothetical protein